jgi:hypothetical protein
MRQLDDDASTREQGLMDRSQSAIQVTQDGELDP